MEPLAFSSSASVCPTAHHETHRVITGQQQHDCMYTIRHLVILHKCHAPELTPFNVTITLHGPCAARRAATPVILHTSSPPE